MQEQLKLFKNLVTTLERQNEALNAQRSTLQKQYVALQQQFNLYRDSHQHDTQLLQQTQIELDRLKIQYTANMQRLRQQLEKQRKTARQSNQLTASTELQNEVQNIKTEMSTFESQMGDRMVGAEQHRADLMQEHIGNVLSFREELAQSLRDMKNIKLDFNQKYIQKIEENGRNRQNQEIQINRQEQIAKQQQITHFKQAINRRQCTISEMRADLEQKSIEIGRTKGENEVLNIKINKLQNMKSRCVHLNIIKFDKQTQTDQLKQDKPFDTKLVTIEEYQVQNTNKLSIFSEGRTVQYKTKTNNEEMSHYQMDETKRIVHLNVAQKSLQECQDLLKINSLVVQDLDKVREILQSSFGPQIELLENIIKQLNRQVSVLQTVTKQIIEPNTIFEQKTQVQIAPNAQTDDPTSLGLLARDLAETPLLQSHHFHQIVKPFKPHTPSSSRASGQFFRRFNLSDLQYRLHQIKVQHEILKRHSLRNKI